MVGLLKVNPLLRAIGVIGVVAALVTSITFAALQSQATLTNNTISSATAGLRVSTDNTAFSDSEPGFTVTGLIPGTGSTKTFYLRNNGDIALDVSARVPVLPGPPAFGYGFSGFQNLTVSITSPACPPAVVNTTMLLLNAGEVLLPCNSLPVGPGTSRTYNIHFDILPDAITGSQAGVGVFNLRFTGSQGL